MVKYAEYITKLPHLFYRQPYHGEVCKVDYRISCTDYALGVGQFVMFVS